MSDHVHVYPTRRDHVTEGLDCWCGPQYLLPCDECDDGCWKCTGGNIPLSRADAETATAPLLIVHNE